MKKLLLAFSVLTLTIITSCQNSNDEFESTVTEKEQVNKAFAKEGETLSEEDIKTIEEAINDLHSDSEGTLSQSARTTILCHTNYLNNSGSACVQVGNQTVSISWQTSEFPSQSMDNGVLSTDWKPRYYSGNIVKSCSCR